MTIKEQIDELIAKYKKEFYEKTGLLLVAFPNAAMAKLPLYDIINYISDYYNFDVNKITTRTKLAVEVKEIITIIALRMGYTDTEIYKALELDRTTLPHTKRKVFKKISNSKTYRLNLYKIIDYLRLNTGVALSDKIDWRSPDEFISTVFAEEIPTLNNKLSINSSKTTQLLEYIKQYPEGVESKKIVNNFGEKFKGKQGVRNLINYLKRSNQIQIINNVCILNNSSKIIHNNNERINKTNEILEFIKASLSGVSSKVIYNKYAPLFGGINNVSSTLRELRKTKQVVLKNRVYKINKFT